MLAPTLTRSAARPGAAALAAVAAEQPGRYVVSAHDEAADAERGAETHAAASPTVPPEAADGAPPIDATATGAPPIDAPDARAPADVVASASGADGAVGDGAAAEGEGEGSGAPLPAAMVEALAGLTAATEKLLEVGAQGASGRALLEFTVGLDRQVTRLEAARAEALGAVETTEAYRAAGCVTTGSWWRHATRRSYGDASREATTARRLGRLGAVGAAWRAGDISARHAQRIACTATAGVREAVEAAEDALVEVARHADPTELGRACRLVAEQAAPLPDPEPDPGVTRDGLDARGELRLAETFDGLWNINGTLDAVLGARLDAELNARMRPEAPDTPPEDRLTGAQRRHAALDALVRAAEDHDDAPTVHGRKPHVLLMVDLRWLVGHDGGRAPLLAGADTPLGRDRALELLHAGTLTPVASWGPWRPVAFGATRRTLPDWLRPLLAVLHRTCRGPGCDRPVGWADAAHLEPFATHHDTRWDTTIPLCRAHHTMLDTGGWTATLDPDTLVVTWTSPDRQTVIETRPPPPDPDQPVLDLLGHSLATLADLRARNTVSWIDRLHSDGHGHNDRPDGWDRHLDAAGNRTRDASTDAAGNGTRGAPSNASRGGPDP